MCVVIRKLICLPVIFILSQFQLQLINVSNVCIQTIKNQLSRQSLQKSIGRHVNITCIRKLGQSVSGKRSHEPITLLCYRKIRSPSPYLGIIVNTALKSGSPGYGVQVAAGLFSQRGQVNHSSTNSALQFRVYIYLISNNI